MDLASSPRSTRTRHQCRTSDAGSPERSLGFVRVWIACGVLILVCLDLRSSDLLRNHALLSAFAFAIYSLLVLFQVRKLQEQPDGPRLALHCMDVVSIVLVALLVHASEAVLILLLLFVLAASAQRLGSRQVLWTAGVSSVLLVGALLLVIAFAPRGAIISLIGFVVFASGLLWQVARADAAQHWETSARAVERVQAIMSRDLHDSVIQTLYAMEFRLERLKSTAGIPRDCAEELAQLQRLAKTCEKEVRELVVQGRPLDLGPKTFVEYVANLAAEFQRETGITVRFLSDGSAVSPPPAVASELVRIVQEALVNIRKHSGARNVSIGFAVDRAHWRLRIDDDGHGFDFAGRLGMLELQAKGQGPYVIRERVSTLGGELEVESTPGRGASLEIVLPDYAHG